MRSANVIFLLAAMIVAGSSPAAETVALKEDFEAPNAATVWTPCAGFSIVEGAGIGEDDLVIEIGPGTGALTGRLLSAARRVIAIEDGHIVRDEARGVYGYEA